MSKREGNPYRLPLALTKEMKIAIDRIVVKEGVADDFPVALKVFRAGLLVYGGFTEKEIQEMYLRRKITNEEVNFLIDKSLVKDFRSMTVEAQKQKEDIIKFDREFKNVIESWEGMKDRSKQIWLEKAKQNPELPNAKALLRMVNENEVS